jgi:arylsulfatase A-like enzyme
MPSLAVFSRKVSRYFLLLVFPLFVIAITASAIKIIDNRYVPYSLYNAGLMTLRDNMNIAMILALLLSLMVEVLFLFFSRAGKKNEDRRFIIILAAAVFIPLFLVGGFLLNTKDIFPPFFTTKGIVANSLYTASVALVCGALFALRRRIIGVLDSATGLFSILRRISLLGVLALVGLNVILLLLRNSHGRTHPSILLISLDTLRWDHLGCYGYPATTSPNIDAFSRDAVLFKEAISQSSWTLPAHMSLLTSQYPLQHGAVSMFRSIDTDMRGPLLSEVLKNSFYTNVAFTNGGPLDRRYGFSEGFDVYHDRGEDFRNPFDERVLQFLDDHKDESFLLFLHTYCIHNYYAPQEYLDMLDPSGEVKMQDWGEILPFLRHYERAQFPNDPGERRKLERIVKLYDASVRYVDGRIGVLLEKLEELDLYDDMIIIITSDHGEEFAEHGHTFHGHTLYEELIRVPLLIKLPGNEYGGLEIDELVEQIDIAPTLLDYLGLPAMSWMRGESLLTLIRGKELHRTAVFSDVLNRKILKFSLRTSEYHLIYETTLKDLRGGKHCCFRLFDIVNDPEEQVDISLAEQETFTALRSELLAWIASMEIDRLVNVEKIEVGEELRERLEALGYVQ